MINDGSVFVDTNKHVIRVGSILSGLSVVVFHSIQYRNGEAAVRSMSVLTNVFLSSQALSLKEAEKTLLSDRASSLQAELSAAALEAERMSREAAHCKEQEQVKGLLVMNSHQSYLTREHKDN